MYPVDGNDRRVSGRAGKEKGYRMIIQIQEEALERERWGLCETDEVLGRKVDGASAWLWDGGSLPTQGAQDEGAVRFLERLVKGEGFK